MLHPRIAESEIPEHKLEEYLEMAYHYSRTMEWLEFNLDNKRERSLAMTALEESMMWARRAIA